ncbi:MAG: hypothetical protein ACI9F9_000177, partial [Candidatus Paceibacteria bacterium]
AEYSSGNTKDPGARWNDGVSANSVPHRGG